MLRTVNLECTLPIGTAAALNAESGRVYTQAMADHFQRAYGTLQPSGSETDPVTGHQPPVLLHPVSREAARQGFYTAVRAAHKNQDRGILSGLPQRPKTYRTTCWRGPALRVSDGALVLARAWNMRPICVPLPPDLARLDAAAFHEARLVWQAGEQRYYWQVVVDEPRQGVLGQRVAAVDLGNVYPATVSDGEVGVIFDVAQLKAAQQQAARRQGRPHARHEGVVRVHRHAGDYRRLRAYWRRQRKEQRLRQKGADGPQSLERLVSQAVLSWAVQNGVGTLVVGDADGLTLRDGSLPAPKPGPGAESLQTRIMRHLAALAKRVGVIVKFVDEALTSQTCPGCGQRNRAHGRRYKCTACGFQGHRDVVGSSNLLSRYLYGALGQVWPGETIVYQPPAVG